MAITATLVKALRERTGVGMMDCKAALEATNGDLDKALTHLREKGKAAAEKRAGRATHEGLIHAYIHPGSKIGVLVEVNCETDFVARNSNFQQFVKDVAMQIAATSPRCVQRAELDPAFVAQERHVFLAQIANDPAHAKKPPQVQEKIVAGRLEKLYQQVCLLEQPFVKDMNITVDQLLKDQIAKIGENITIRRFTRYQLGEE